MASYNVSYNLTDLSFNMTSSNMADPTTPHHEVALSLKETRFAVQTILTPVVVVIGLLGNVLNIMVLVQPCMRSSTNIYILVLSLADSIYLIFNFALSILDCRKRGLSDFAYHFNPYGRFMSNFSGNVAVWVTVAFTVERYIAVCFPMKGKRWCTVNRAKLASVAIVILTLINTVPTIFELEVVHTENGPRCQYTSLAESFSYEMVYSWWYVTVFTFIPLKCLAIFNIVLIRALFVASRKRQQLVLVSSRNSQRRDFPSQSHKENFVRNGYCQKSNISVQENDCNSTSHLCLTSTGTTSSCQPRQMSNSSKDRSYNSSPKSQESMARRQGKRMSREQNKVTLLLVTIVMIFLLCQLPWTALFLYKTYLSNNNLSGNPNHIKIAGNICNLLGLINASVNFYLYSCFSERFRKTFKSLVLFWRRRSAHLQPSIV